MYPPFNAKGVHVEITPESAACKKEATWSQDVFQGFVLVERRPVCTDSAVAATVPLPYRGTCPVTGVISPSRFAVLCELAHLKRRFAIMPTTSSITLSSTTLSVHFQKNTPAFTMLCDSRAALLGTSISGRIYNTSLLGFSTSSVTTFDFADDAEDIDEFEHLEESDDVSFSLTSALSYVFEDESVHGRQYHGYKAGRYPLPNDKLEQEREGLNHSVMIEIAVSAFPSSKYTSRQCINNAGLLRTDISSSPTLARIPKRSLTLELERVRIGQRGRTLGVASFH